MNFEPIKVQCNVKIALNDPEETIIDIPVDELGEIHNLDNYITSVTVEGSLGEDVENPVGVISSGSVSLELVTNDRLFMPDNEESPYYGYMDNTAIVYIDVTYKKLVTEATETEQAVYKDVLEPFGKTYVSNWYGSITDADPNRVIIEATDLLSIIGRNEVPVLNLSNSTSITSYLSEVINSLNSKNHSRYSLYYDEADLDFKAFPNMQYSNLNVENMSDCLNSISQATITNIFIDKDNKLKTDYCADDKAKESIALLSDSINITSAEAGRGLLVNHTGIKVTYSEGVVNNATIIVEMQGQRLLAGDNAFTNIELGNDLYKINCIEVTSEDNVDFYIKEPVYNKKTLNMIINSNSSTVCNIKVYGQTINKSNLYIEKYIDGNENNNSLYPITNELLPISDINKYATNMIKLLKIKNSKISIKGWFPPYLRVGKTVEVDCTKSIKAHGFYKIVKLTWVITDILEANAELLRLIS